MNKKKKIEQEEVKEEEVIQEEITDATETNEVEEVDFQDQYLRLYAEFDNFRKRTMREKADLISSAGSDIIAQLLSLIDDFDRAEANPTEDAEAMREGMKLIHAKLISTLTSKGLKTMEAKAGDEFDVDKHEAIARIPAPSEELKDKIVDVVEKGYMLGDKVLRYSKVVIGQ